MRNAFWIPSGPSGPFVPICTHVAVVLVASLVTAQGCQSRADRETDIANGDDPLAALTVYAVSSRYTMAYWLTQAQTDTALWGTARTYCAQQRSAAQGAKPNCAAVYDAEFELAGRSVRPRRSPASQRPESLIYKP